MKLPFSSSKSKSQKSFKILSEKEINQKNKKTNMTLFGFLKQAIQQTFTQPLTKTIGQALGQQSLQNQHNKIKYIRASSTKEYYKNLKK
jgi:SOS-response transcriptional repressor LexA